MKRSRLSRSSHGDIKKMWDFVDSEKANVTQDADTVQKIDFRTLKKK
jgi:hypothetical protein